MGGRTKEWMDGVACARYSTYLLSMDKSPHKPLVAAQCKKKLGLTGRRTKEEEDSSGLIKCCA